MKKELWDKFALHADTLRQRAWDIRKTGDLGDAFSEFEKKLSEACMNYHAAVFAGK